MEKIAISEFKARCLAILEKVGKSHRGVLITRRGEPIAEVIPPSAAHLQEHWLGSATGTGSIEGDIVSPLGAGDWEALR